MNNIINLEDHRSMFDGNIDQAHHSDIKFTADEVMQYLSIISQEMEQDCSSMETGGISGVVYPFIADFYARNQNLRAKTFKVFVL
jgi:hypothetical protein